MGYYTRYTLTVKILKPQQLPVKESLAAMDKKELIEIIANNKAWYNKNITPDDIIKIFNNDPDNKYNMMFEGSGDTSEECKWYEHDEVMRNFSRKYPDILFLLEGVGEESEDIWKKYYKNGKCQIANVKFVFDEYDESKLV